MIKINLKNSLIISGALTGIIFSLIKWRNDSVESAILHERYEQEGKIKVWKDMLVLKEQEALQLKQIVDETVINTKVDTFKIYIRRNDKINSIGNLTTDGSIELFSKYLNSQQ